VKTSRVILLIMLTTLVGANPSPGESARPLPALAVFKSRAAWKALSPDYLAALAGKFSAAAEAKRFALLCESSGILANSFAQLAQLAATEPERALSGTAAALTDYGDALSDRTDFYSAIAPLNFAITIEADCVPAYVALSRAQCGMHDFDTAIAVLRAAPAVSITGTDSVDFAFALAFAEAEVLITKVQLRWSEDDRRALVAKLNEARALIQTPASGIAGGEPPAVSGDPFNERLHQLQLVDYLLMKYGP